MNVQRKSQLAVGGVLGKIIYSKIITGKLEPGRSVVAFGYAWKSFRMGKRQRRKAEVRSFSIHADGGVTARPAVTPYQHSKLKIQILVPA